MKISFRKSEFFIVLALYLFALYFFTLPLRENKLPFGDVDASSHFTIGDHMYAFDKSVAKVPYSISFRYGGQNSVVPWYLWYPPQFWTLTAIGQVIGGERIMPFFIIIAIACSLIILSSYFLARKLFGFWPAALSSFLLIFSARDYMIYLWGQWPQSLSFAFTPLAIYCFFSYYKSLNEKAKPIYMYMLAIFLAAQFFFHPQGMVASIGAISILAVFLYIKNRSLPFRLKHAALSILILAVLSASLAPFNVGEFIFELKPGGSGSSGNSASNLDKLFKWYHGIKNDPGLPDFYFTYEKTHGSMDGGLISWWTLPLLLVGVAVLALRRSDEDLVMLGWLVSFYFLTRLVVIGMATRDMRMFAYEAHVFYPIIALGLVFLWSLPKSQKLKSYLKIGLIAVFIYLAVSVNARSAYNTLNGMQNSIGRINPWQYEAAEWLRANTEIEADVYDIGTLGFNNYAAKIKWMGVLAQRHFIQDDSERNMTDYLLIDYTEAVLLNNQDYFNSVQAVEQSMVNSTPIYNKNNIRVYKANGIKV